MRFSGKTALITGGNSGIGLATARLLLAEGARVAITGRDSAKLQEAAAELGAGVTPIQADLNNADDIARAIQSVKDTFGRLDILFANAGISGPTPLGNTPQAVFDLIINTNVTAVFFTIQAALPLMESGAAIILNGSVMRELGRPGTAAYAASKGAITAMAGVFAGELAPRGIRVNTVIPGATRTPIWTRGARAGGTIEQTETALSPSVPMARLAEPEEVAQAVLFMASSAASGMTGAEIVIDGGTTGAPWGAPMHRQ
jgi:NAD(P)-dependent dehydrogenase (short-subunit alcohol dehydrogenase family)